MAPSPPELSVSTADTVVDETGRASLVPNEPKKKQRKGHQPTMEIPDRLKDKGDEGDEDVVPPRQGPQMLMNMNQSIFGLIAAAGSTVDFNDRFEGQSSEDEEVDDEAEDSRPGQGAAREDIDFLRMADGTRQTQAPTDDGAGKEELGHKPTGSQTTGDNKRSKRRRSGNLLWSIPQLPRLVARSRSKISRSKGSTFSSHKSAASGPDGVKPELSSPTVSPTTDTPAGKSRLGDSRADHAGSRLAPVMSRMLEARAEISSRPSFDLPKDDISGAGDTGPSALSQRLKEIFEFDDAEEVVQEYPCWLLQSVLLQGYMYITAKHICFYAYLPKKAHEVSKAGYLSKSGKRNPRYSRYWFRLKGDVLAYYHDASNQYFPHGQIDLRYAISANVTDKDKESVHFAVVTHHRTYYFRADSGPSAKEWVKCLQRVIFRSHNDGDSVKISLPIANVMDIEDSQIVDFADTCKIRVYDNEETYAVDEYFFSFFSSGKEAINVLKLLIQDSLANRPEPEVAGRLRVPSDQDQPTASSLRSSLSAPMTQDSAVRSLRLLDSVKATLPPMAPTVTQSTRASGDFSRSSLDAFRAFGKKSLDAERDAPPRRSYSITRSRSTFRNVEQSIPERNELSDSYVQSSMEAPSLSGLAASSDDATSQILRGSEVFHQPTLGRRSAPTSVSDDADKKETDRDESAVSRCTAITATSGACEKPGQQGAPTLHNIAKISAAPLQRAGVFANYLNRTGRNVGSYLATESMGYVEKVSGMWKGGRKHYDEHPSLRTDDEIEEDGGEGTEAKLATTIGRFRAHFALAETEKLQATYFGYLMRVLPLYGKIYIGDRHFCFRSLLPGTRTKLILPIKDIEVVEKEKGFRFGYQGMVVTIRGHEEIFFEFNHADLRDDCTITLMKHLEASRYLRESGVLGREEAEQAKQAIAEHDALHRAREQDKPWLESNSMQDTPVLSDTILFDDPKASFLNFKPAKALTITCLTIGSRGDVQPYIALCKGLLAEGHKPRIATHAEFRGWVEGHGIEFAPIAGDPGELMRLCIQNGTFTYTFLREANATLRDWIDELLGSAYYACKGSDVIMESPSAMAGIHIAEALQVPYFRAFTMPWTRTRAYPHAFVMPDHKMGGAYNYITYVMFDNVFWKATAGQVNKWRRKTLKLPPTNLEKLQPNKVPFLYNFSPAVVAPPLDYSDWIRVTGYWFLDEGTDWTPPDNLREFIEKARQDKKKLVYVGFGSIIVADPVKMTQEVIQAVLKADVRCIMSKGWSDRPDHITNKDPAAAKEASKVEVELPPDIFQIKSAPHDWLFGQMDAVAHHGGSGTTGASLRAGVPTIIRPFFGDQFFFGGRVEDLGVGICLKKWGARSFARALWEACHSERMRVKARVLGEAVRKDKGVDTAIQCIYRDLEYARTLILSKAGKNAPKGYDNPEDDEEESWTFVGGSPDDVEPDLVVKQSALAEIERSIMGNAKDKSTVLGSTTVGTKRSGTGTARSTSGSATQRVSNTIETLSRKETSS